MSHKAKYVRNFVQLVVGLSFGIFNMMTWFGFNIKDWWMEILHLSLLIISIYGLRILKVKNKTTKRAQKGEKYLWIIWMMKGKR